MDNHNKKLTILFIIGSFYLTCHLLLGEIAYAKSVPSKEINFRSYDNKVLTEEKHLQTPKKHLLSSGKTISQALSDVKVALKNKQLEEAEKIVDEILIVDPFNRKALNHKDRFNSLRHIDHVTLLNSIRNKEAQKNIEILEEEQIPYTEKMQFPDSEHLERVQKRIIPDKTHQFEKMKSSTSKMRVITEPETKIPKDIENALDTIISFEFFDVQLQDALAFIREKTGINIVPSMDMPNDPITLKLNNVSIKTALKYMLPKGVSYEIDDNIVYILKDKLVLRIYDIRDLLINLDDRVNDNGSSISNKTVSGGKSFGGVASFGGEERDANDRVEELTRLITTTIAPNSWRKEYGRITTREDRPGDLIVVNTFKVHKQIEDILTSMRSTQHLQINIEARFIQMSDRFLEDIGVELQNVSINPSDSSSIDFSVDTSAGAAGGAKSEGLNLTYSVFKDYEIELLLNAVQESDEAEILTSPRITLSNTQRGSIRVVNEISYVSTYEIISQVPQPVIDVVEDGTTFDVRPVVSTDRKHVFLEVHPNITVVDFDTLPFEIAVPFIGGDGTTFQILELTIEQPLIKRQELSVTVDVPDRGTLMIGGLGATRKKNSFGGVPVLSKIPIIKRLFSRESEEVERTNLIIILKPTILIRDEEMAVQMVKK